MLCTNKREIKCKAGGAANPGRPASLGQLSDWLLLPWEAVLGDEGVSQNQSPRSSDFHSLRMCWVDTVSLRFTPCVHTYSTYFLWSCWRTSSAFGARKHRWLFFLLFGSFLFVFAQPTWVVFNSLARLHFSPLRHGFGLDCGLRCERVLLVLQCGAAQRLLEQHQHKVSLWILFFFSLKKKSRAVFKCTISPCLTRDEFNCHVKHHGPYSGEVKVRSSCICRNVFLMNLWWK